MGYNEIELSILFVDDLEIQKLNHEYRKINKPTNVLSFPMQEGMFSNISKTIPKTLLGDVVISIETARREAQSLNIMLTERISQLLVHGILHLTGYNHEKDFEQNSKMELKSMEILKMIETNPNLAFF